MEHRARTLAPGCRNRTKRTSNVLGLTCCPDCTVYGGAYSKWPSLGSSRPRPPQVCRARSKQHGRPALFTSCGAIQQSYIVGLARNTPMHTHMHRSIYMYLHIHTLRCTIAGGRHLSVDSTSAGKPNCFAPARGRRTPPQLMRRHPRAVCEHPSARPCAAYHSALGVPEIEAQAAPISSRSQAQLGNDMPDIWAALGSVDVKLHVQ